MIILIGFFTAILKQIRKNRKLYEEKINAEMTAREEERKRISKDLHDELGSTLTGVNMYLQVVKGYTDKDELIISKIQTSVSHSLEQIKQIMNNLYPISLDNYGLLSCLCDFIEEINHSNSINIIFSDNVENLEEKINKEDKIHIFRIFKEVIQNTIKHSNSPVLSIRFSENKEKIIIETIDQGQGFDSDDISIKKKGHGLKNIINRVELINGEIFLDARIRKGVSYTIEIPKFNAN